MAGKAADGLAKGATHLAEGIGKAFDAMLQFTRECVAHCPDVRMTVVDVISPEDIEKSRQVCESTGAKFRVRSFAAGR